MRISFQISGIIFMPQNCISFVCRCWKSSNRIAKGARLWITSVAKVARIVVWNNHSYSEQNSYHQAPWSMDTQSCSLYFGAYYTSTTLKHFCPSTSLFLVKSAATGWGKVCRIVNVGGSRFFLTLPVYKPYGEHTVYWLRHPYTERLNVELHWFMVAFTTLLQITKHAERQWQITVWAKWASVQGLAGAYGPSQWSVVLLKAWVALLWTRPLMWTGRAVSFTLKQRSMPVSP